MKEQVSFYIIDSSGNPLFSRETFIQGTNPNTVLFSNFIVALDKFVKELGGEQTSVIKIGASQIFALDDMESKLKFIIKSSKTANPIEMERLLCDIRYLFQVIYAGHLNDPIDAKKELIDSFRTELDKLLKRGDNMSKFLSDL